MNQQSAPISLVHISIAVTTQNDVCYRVFDRLSPSSLDNYLLKWIVLTVNRRLFHQFVTSISAPKLPNAHTSQACYHRTSAVKLHHSAGQYNNHIKILGANKTRTLTSEWNTAKCSCSAIKMVMTD